MHLTQIHSDTTRTMNVPPSVLDLLAQADVQQATNLRQRLQSQYPTLRDRLQRLYGNHTNFSNWFDQLLTQTISLALSRDNSLCDLDLQREANPNWHGRSMLGYCAYTEKFGGSLQGIQQRIPHLQELGVTYLHLLPFLKAGTPPNDGGFAVASYEEVDPFLGNLDDLQALTKALREAGISLCSDFVLNHVSHDHIWAQKAIGGDKYYQSFFHWKNSAEEVASWEKNLIQIFPSTAPGNFTFIPQVGAWAWTTFYPYQWDLNYAQPAVFEEMVKALLQLANWGVEAFRLDSTGFLWKREGTNCMNQPEVHWLLQALRCIVNIAAPGTLLKAEAIMPTQDLPPYFGLGDTQAPECHVAYHSSLMSASWVSLAEEKVQLIEDVLAHTPALPDGCNWMTYVRCHDDIGWNVLRPELNARGDTQHQRLRYASQFFAGLIPASYSKGASFQASNPNVVHGTNGMTAALVGLASAQDSESLRWAESRHALLHGLSLFVGGIPLIYMGDEYALGNISEAELQARQGTDGRELHRPLFDFQAFNKRHDEQSTPGRIYRTLRQMIDARRNDAAFSSHQPLQTLNSEHPSVLLLKRGADVYGIFNFSSNSVTLASTGCQEVLALGQCADLLDATVVATENCTLEPYGMLWLSAAHPTR